MGCYSMSDGDPNPPNPDPMQFDIVSPRKSGRYEVLLVRYKGCTTFGGLKLLVVRDLCNDPRTLDPHFHEGGPVVARFEPNGQGHELAYAVIHVLSRGTYQ